MQAGLRTHSLNIACGSHDVLNAVSDHSDCVGVNLVSFNSLFDSLAMGTEQWQGEECELSHQNTKVQILTLPQAASLSKLFGPSMLQFIHL